MNSLIGERFLKRFLGNRDHRHKANPDGKEQSMQENDGDSLSIESTAEPDCQTREDLPEKEAVLEIKTGESKQNQNAHG